MHIHASYLHRGMQLRSACLNKYSEKFIKFCDLVLCTVVLAFSFSFFGRTLPYPSKLQLLIQEHAESLHETAVSVRTWKHWWREGEDGDQGAILGGVRIEEAGRTGEQGATRSRQLLGRRRPPLQLTSVWLCKGKRSDQEKKDGDLMLM